MKAAEGPEQEVVLVVDVSSFTEDGFIGTASYEGTPVEVEFDAEDKGAILPAAMAKRLKVKKGSSLWAILENDRTQRASVEVAGVGKAIRISSAKVYYGVGKEGGAIVRLRKA